MELLSRFSSAISIISGHVGVILSAIETHKPLEGGLGAVEAFVGQVVNALPTLAVSAIGDFAKATNDELDILARVLVDDAEDKSGNATKLYVALALLSRALLPPAEARQDG